MVGTKSNFSKLSEVFMNKEEYGDYVMQRQKKSPIFKNCLRAFCIGGAICALGQSLLELYLILDIELLDAYSLVSITLIFIAVTLTGIGVFDTIAKVAGAGTLVPITGFANALSASAIDTRSEGYVLGVGAKVFTIAGPVILFATVSGAIYGVIYYFAINFWW